jgi:hypothetical protein
MFKIVKWHSDERVDIDDMEQATSILDLWESVRSNRVFHMPEGRNSGTVATEARILSGFNIDLVNDASVGGNGYCRLNRGGGFFKVVKEGETKLGMLVGDEGQTSQTLDFTAKAPGSTQAVWIRANFQDSSSENRVFWNSSTTAEYVDYVATREEVTWEYNIRLWADPSPGDEWVKVWKVPIVAGPAIGTIVDYRHFYFEGDAAGSYAQEWGSGSGDRSSNRALYGIQDLHNFVSAIRRQMSLMIDGSSWWTTPAIHLSDLSSEHKSGGNHGDVVADSLRTNMNGVTPDGVWIDASARDIGTSQAALRLEDWSGHETSYVLDAAGRPARGHVFFDDFTMYRNWTAKATNLPPPYAVVAGGSADAYASVSSKIATVPTHAKHGGCCVLETTANGADSMQILGPACMYLNATNGIYLRCFFRLALDGNGTASRVDQIGLDEYGGGKSFMFRHDQTLYGDGNWRFYVNDGVATQAVDLGVAPSGTTYQNFYFGFSSHTSIDVWVSGMIAPTTVTIATMQGAADTMLPFWSTANNGTATAHFMLVDLVDIWDRQAITGNLGVAAS